MRHFAFAAVLFVFTGSIIAQQPSDPKKKTDPELLQGIWEIVGLENGGKAHPAANYKGNTLAFTKDKATLRESGYQSIEFTFSLDPAKTPKTIELTARGNQIHGIYKLDGDDLTLSVSLGGLRPPGEFATKTGGDSETFTLKRSLWVRYTDKTFGFTADFPAKPTETKRDDSTPAGQVTTTIYTARGDKEKLSFAVSVTPMPGPLNMREAEEAIEAVLKAIVSEADKSGKVKVESEGKFKPPGSVTAAREYTISLKIRNEKDQTIRVRLYAAGDRVYALTATGTDEEAKSLIVGRFWSYFRLPQPKKDPPQK